MHRIREALHTVIEQNAISLELTERQNGVWSSQINDKTLLDSAIFILAVQADMKIDEVREKFPAQIKIGPIEYIGSLVTKALPGIQMQALPVAPRQIPYHANFVYFILNKDHSLWQELEESSGLAFHVGGKFAGLKLELWAIRDY